MSIPEIKGLADLLTYLSDSPLKMHAGVRVGLYVGAKLIEAEAKSNCPVEHGSLRESIRVAIHYSDEKIVASIRAGDAVVDGAYIAYAHLIEFSGAAPHVIKSKTGKRLTFGGRSYAAINHPGMKAHPFLRPALDTKELEAVAMVDQEIQSVLK